MTRTGTGQRIRRTDFTKYLAGIGGSIRFDARKLDHPIPLVNFVGDELAEMNCRAGKHRASEVGKLCPDPWIGEPRIDLLC